MADADQKAAPQQPRPAPRGLQMAAYIVAGWNIAFGSFFVLLFGVSFAASRMGINIEPASSLWYALMVALIIVASSIGFWFSRMFKGWMSRLGTTAVVILLVVLLFFSVRTLHGFFVMGSGPA